MSASKLIKKQTKTIGPRPIAGYGKGAEITARLRYDDECGNGHNTFSITADVVTPASRRRNDIEAGGCLHEDIARVFPELEPYIKWHLTSSDGPMHYIANTLYWLGYDLKWSDGKPGSPPNIAHARSAAVWPDMPEDMLAGNPLEGLGRYTRAEAQAILESRHEQLQADFRAAMESLGFTY